MESPYNELNRIKKEMAPITHYRTETATKQQIDYPFFFAPIAPIVQILFIRHDIRNKYNGSGRLFHEATFAQSEQARQKKPFTQLLRKLEKSPYANKKTTSYR